MALSLQAPGASVFTAYMYKRSIEEVEYLRTH